LCALTFKFVVAPLSIPFSQSPTINFTLKPSQRHTLVVPSKSYCYHNISTHYDTLGVQRDATAEEIKKSYRSLQIRYHPDKTGSLPEQARKEGARISQAANVAYETLSDAELRAGYDATLPPPFKRARFDYGARTYFDPSSLATAFNWQPPKASPPPSPWLPRPTARLAPDTHNVLEGDWAFAISGFGNYSLFESGITTVTIEEYKIVMLMKIRRRPSKAMGNPDVRISISSTPQGRCIYKIESLHRHIMTSAGPEQQLVVTIHTAKDTAAGLRKQITKSWDQFRFGWQLDISKSLQPPYGVLTYGTCLVFMAKPPHLKALFNGVPLHADNPRFVLLKDKDLQTQTGQQCDFGDIERSWSAATKVAYDTDCEKMWRLAAVGWQPKGSGKGDDGFPG
jgi:curved DNA-binding protein CbpA